MAKYIGSINDLINQIRKEEREKILEEMKVNASKVKPHHFISELIEEWGEENEIRTWHLCKIKNAIYTIVRYSLEIDKMADIREEDLEMAESVVINLTKIIRPTINN